MVECPLEVTLVMLEVGGGPTRVNCETGHTEIRPLRLTVGTGAASRRLEVFAFLSQAGLWRSAPSPLLGVENLAPDGLPSLVGR